MMLKLDLHVHSDRSPDGRSNISEIIKAAEAKGLDGIALSDHDLLSEGKNGNLIIIPACECSTTDGHILGYFLLDLPTVLKGQSGRLPSAKEAIDEIHRLGGLAVWAHPYEKAVNISQEMASMADGIEAANSRACFKNRNANIMAQKLAQTLGKPSYGGSDAHHKSEVGNAFTLLYCKCKNLDSIKEALFSGQGEAVFVVNTRRVKKGLSQLCKCKKSKVSFIRIIKAYFYIIYCLILDLVKGW
ncbi:MAG: PHP-associated domain-containing protein [Clostridiaceae bacterium]|nr:PHP-associated domain-containing protein [Clostridiaceae bacterium]